LDATDLELVQRSRSGDRQAFDMLVGRHAGSLYRIAAAMLGHADDAQDAVQETFLGAFRGLDGFRGHASVRTWLCRILVRQVARLRRRAASHRTMPLDPTGEQADPAVPDPTAASDARLDVAELLGRLVPEHRDVLVLREIQGMTYEQIAAALEVPRGTVESRLFRARQAMGRLMGSSRLGPSGSNRGET
jgi:RNA polymerase sigma-70 factor (ECF subfamily)